MDNMDHNSWVLARDLTELNAALRLIPRDGDGCVASCPKPKCSCPSNQNCQFTVPTNCQSCAKAVCVAADSDPSGDDDSGGSGGSGPNVGAIAGGVIGGIIFLAILSYLVWRFVVRPRRSHSTESAYEAERRYTHRSEKDNASRLTRRSSTHTVHSIASTVLTRASNIIQIAYIPGVTNRATPSSPDSSSVLVPPVPPIPAQHADNSRQFGQDDQHFFMPGDLRDSTYSGLSGYSDRTSYARTSYAPRSSIASTIYGKQAQVAAPAQTGMRAKPTMVSVRSVGSAGSGSPGSTPPVPSIDFDKFGGGRPKSGASAFSVGSTFLNNANTATQARAQVIKVGGGLKKIEINSKPESSAASTTSTTSSMSGTPRDESNKEANTSTAVGQSTVDQGPFSDPPEGSPAPHKVATPITLEVVAEDEDEDHKQEEMPSRPSLPAERGTSPFGDEHATKE